MIDQAEVRVILSKAMYMNHNEHKEKVSSIKCTEMINGLIAEKMPLVDINAMVDFYLDSGVGNASLDDVAERLIVFLKDVKQKKAGE